MKLIKRDEANVKKEGNFCKLKIINTKFQESTIIQTMDL